MSRGDRHATGEKGHRRRAVILDAAEGLFADQGYERTTTQDVADAAGILKGSLYYYVSSKEELLFRVVLRTHERLHAFVVTEADYASLVPLEGVRTFIARHVEWVLKHRSVAALYGREVGVVRSVDTWWAELLDERHRHEQYLFGLLREVAPPSDTDRDVLMTTRAFLSMANGPRQWFHDEGSATAAEVAEHHADLAVRSLPLPG
ncbi:TetR/AcrR family transcriptional regulator [Aeromicrobium fastidiosum]|uniref:TetR/AcrR family transcriptional regulator n=1 Tax=Aeromicrobium TaxID=2040 RepID=UPI00177E2854|nr:MULTISPECIES: TetR/AcrR family transcriptional regulator [Aeromicrobium]MBD8605499.1 TetR family transcriptional regulator [Aeromicrobium sp. CFBP 8757]MCL8250416.1 TetR/AcrR family transcriptional regulator [Aeromicrobium fastidiosum]